MRSKLAVSSVISLVAGASITWISGLFRDPLMRMGIDVVQRGMPLPWSFQVIPQPMSHILWDALLTDIVFWTVVVFLALTGLIYLSERNAAGHKTKLAE